MKARRKHVKALFESAPAIKHRETKRRGKLNSLGKDVPDGAGGRSLPRRLALSPPGGGHSVISCLEGHTHTHTHTHTHPSLTSLYMYLSVLATLLKQHPNNAHTHTHTHTHTPLSHISLHVSFSARHSFGNNIPTTRVCVRSHDI